MAEKILMSEFKSLSKEPWTNIELINENIFEWHVALIVLNPDSLYCGAFFKAKMTFPKEYPYRPPGKLSLLCLGMRLLTDCDRVQISAPSIPSPRLPRWQALYLDSAPTRRRRNVG